MKQGLQATFPHFMLQTYGCYFFALAEWAEQESGHEFIEDELIYYYDLFVQRGTMEQDCFLVSPTTVLNDLIGYRKYRDVYRSPSRPDTDTYCIYLKKQGHAHFVLTYKGKLWDSLPPDRPGNVDYKIDSYRVFI